MRVWLRNDPLRLLSFVSKYCLSICLIWMFYSGQAIQAQVPQSILPFESSAPLPREYTQSVEEACRTMLKSQTDIGEEETAFHLQNAYQIHQLFSSGKVLFNDSATAYLHLLADQILHLRPELRASLRFFVVRSPEVNAYATNNGLILVNLGLLAQIEEEAQLAFILCHEISHYIRQHPLDIYLNGAQESLSLKSSGIPEDEEKAFSARYNQEKELEADRLGWELFLEAGYDAYAGLRALDLVDKAGSAFEEIPFDPDWLNMTAVAAQKPDQPETLGDQDRLTYGLSSSTHPHVSTRRQILEEFIQAQQPEPGALSYVDQVDFAALRLRSRYEVVRLQLLNRQYEQALYNCYCLESEHGEDPELDRIKAMSLYALATYANEGKFWDVHEDYLFVEGEPQRLNFLIEQLSPGELTAIALRQVWGIHRQFPEDDALRLMNRELMESMGNQYLETLDNQNANLAGAQAIFFPAMLEMMQDSVFAADIGKIIIRNRQLKDLAQTPLMRPSGSETEPTLDLVGLRLGLEKVVWVDPFYQVVRHQEDQPMALLESEDKERRFTELIATFSNQMNVQYELYSMHEFKPEDILAVRQMSLLQSWIAERTRHGDLSLVSPLYNEIKDLADHLGTPYFVWVGCIVQQEKRRGKGIVATAGILLPPLLPYSIWYLVTPRPQTLMYCIIYSAITGEYEVIYPHAIGMKDRPDVIRSATYDLLNQISQE